MSNMLDSVVVGRIKQPKLHICTVRRRGSQDERIHLNIKTQLPIPYAGGRFLKPNPSTLIKEIIFNWTDKHEQDEKK